MTITEKQKERDAVMEKKKRRRLFCKKMTLVYIPIGAISFVVIYWAVGLKNAQFYLGKWRVGGFSLGLSFMLSKI